MRSALLCVFFALGVGKGGRQAGAATDFRPMPIPLGDWNYEFRAPRVGTLHEAVNTESPPSVAAVPAHYWEDALRHSVYLTLVRDKIDQLIAKGSVISPDSKPDQYNSKEVDDHDLWDKIKTAPFDRKSETEHNSFGDVTIMAKGRLLEEKNGFRFTEDERKNEKCSDESCMKGVKAIWSVKRVRQRDEEVSPGKYHYELTFSVMSQTPKKLKKPYENPVRTFTVRENPPNSVLGRPQPASHHYDPVQPPPFRPQRAIWFHRNLAPNPSTQSRRYHQSLDRIFLSFFSDDDSQPEPPRFRPPVTPHYQQQTKGPHIGSSSEQYQQKKLMPYPYKPPVYKYVRGPLAAPPLAPFQQHFVDPVDTSFVAPPIDQRYVTPTNVYKTTRPAVLPTPLPETVLPMTTKNFTYDLSNAHNYTESSTREIEPDASLHKTYSKPKLTPIKFNYFPDHIRPPVYNAPPGVFVTMDKKPFKPMPPLKGSHTLKYKHRPSDFRPSPQLLDMQFSDPESHSTVDTAFRPILMEHKAPVNRTTPSGNNNKKGDKHYRKPQSAGKRPPKKHGNIKSKPVTTSAPDIITVYNDDFEDETPEWANIVSAFPVTAPIKTSKIKSTTESIESVDTAETANTMPPSYTESSSTISTASNQTNKNKRITTTSSTEPSTTPTYKPKRTRPPPKFTKPEKVKKHKRITTTTKTPVKNQVKSPSSPVQATDLTPQASSAATRPNKPWEPKSKTISTTESNTVNEYQPGLTSTVPSTTTTKATTTTTTAKPVTTTATYTTSGTTQPKNKNRFRQSTLMHKGTSVNHDKWSVINTDKEKIKTIISASGKFSPRRKGSNFQGHASTTQRSVDVDHKMENHRDTKMSTESTTTVKDQTTTQTLYEQIGDEYRTQDKEEEDKEGYEEKTRNGAAGDASDEKEYIFGLSTTTPNERTNEISDAEDPITEETVTTTIHSIPKNKTKCNKKKKHENLMTTSEKVTETSMLKQEPSMTTTSTMATDILKELIADISYDDTEKSKEPISELDEEGSEKYENFAQINDDFEDFLDKEEQYEKGENASTYRDEEDYNYEDYHDRSLSFLELMAME